MSKLKTTKRLLLCAVSAVLFTGCSEAESEKTNYLGGAGEIYYSEGPNARGATYDDENIYFNSNKGVLRLDKSGLLTFNCDIATCTHDSQECMAALNSGEYFIFGGRLYQYYTESDIVDSAYVYSSFIKDCDSGEIVFDNPLPDGLDESKKLDSNTKIFYITIINQDYIKVQGHRHAYILDKEFNIVCWYGDVGEFQWGTMYDDKFYYINDLYQMIYIDVNTTETGVLELDEKVIFAGADGEDLFYIDEYNNFYRYSFKDGTKTKIGENIWFFSVYDGYIYCDRIMGETREKLIVDYDGNVKYDYTENTYMGTDDLIKIGDKLYNQFYDEGRLGIAVMNVDGTGYTEIFLD